MIGPDKGPEAYAHNVFDCTSANEDKIPLTICLEMDITYFGLKAPRV